MISTGELKKGVAIELDGELWQILDYHHIKMGRGSAQVRITLRNIKRGQTVEQLGGRPIAETPAEKDDPVGGLLQQGGQAAHTLPLAPRSIALWKEMAAEVGEDLGIRTEGGLMLAEDTASLEWLRRKSAMERRWGIESHIFGANELCTVAPAISEDMVGADFVPAEGYGDPLRGTMAVLKLALDSLRDLLTTLKGIDGLVKRTMKKG